MVSGSAGFVRSLDVEGQTPSATQAANTSRRAFGFGVVTGALACAGLAIVALLQGHQKTPGAGATGDVFAFAPTGRIVTPGRVQPDQAAVQQLIKDIATSKDGSAMRSTVEMLAKSSAAKSSFCYGLPGALPPAGNYDPFGFTNADEATVKRYREAELKHGRVSMLASLGFITQEGFHGFFQGEAFDHKPAAELLGQLPPALLFGVTLGIGICEAASIERGWVPGKYEIKKGYVNGDLGWDPLGLKPSNPAEFRKKQTVELQNGRLAMLAAAGFILQEVQTGTTFTESDIFKQIGDSGIKIPGP
jgi:hypothetical protein